MNFISFEYIGFILFLFVLYWKLGAQGQNRLLLLGSLFFYSMWSSHFAILILFSASLDYYLVRTFLKPELSQSARLKAVWVSVIYNILLLFKFKYHNFFIDDLLYLFQSLHIPVDPQGFTTKILVPIGISFYTLQKLSYVFEVYYRKIEIEKNWEDFMLFVCFFPQLASGPIERAWRILPQFKTKRVFNALFIKQGLWLFFFGVFKKVFLADHLGSISEDLFNESEPSFWSILFGIYAYAGQLYCDFSGYSDMARGSARLFGIDLMQNFNAPYLSRNISEYWQRWHISLSSWLNDYVYNPCLMIFRNLGTGAILIATAITFLLSGLWHGTGWEYFAWSWVHIFALWVFVFTKSLRKKWKKKYPEKLLEFGGMFLTFHTVCLGYLFFRSPDLSTAFYYLGQMTKGFSHWNGDFAILIYLVPMMIFQKIQLQKKTPFWIFEYKFPLQVLIYFLMLFAILRLYAPAEKFIYFQF